MRGGGITPGHTHPRFVISDWRCFNNGRGIFVPNRAELSLQIPVFFHQFIGFRLAFLPICHQAFERLLGSLIGGACNVFAQQRLHLLLAVFQPNKRSGHLVLAKAAAE